MTQVYRVPAVNLHRLISELDTLNKRAKKLRVAPVSYSIVGEERITVGSRFGDLIRTIHLVTVEGGIPQLNGWHFVAAIHPTDNGNIIAAMPGEDVPAQYRTATLDCEHCGTKRYRKAVYIVRHDDGRFAQVGANCLGDFTGAGHTPAQLAAMAEFESAVRDDVEDQDGYLGYGSFAQAVDTLDFLCHVAAVSRTLGFATRKMVESLQAQRTTGEIAWDLATLHPLTCERMEDLGYQVTDADRERAEVALAWAQGLDATDTFTHNMIVAALNKTVEPRAVGIAAYLIEAYRRAHEVAVKAERTTTSEHIGTVGARIIIDTLSVIRIREFENDFGTCFFVTMMTEDGSVVSWKASTYPAWAYEAEAARGTFSIKATVKAHGEYRGEKQTTVTRAVMIG